MNPHAIPRTCGVAGPAAVAALALAAVLASSPPALAQPGYQKPPAPAGASRIAGTATYRERMAMPPGAVFEAVLEDVSRVDAPAVEIGRTTLERPGQVPIRFEIAYDHRRIKSSGVYTVRTAIRADGRLMWASEARHAVLTQGNPNKVEIVMRRVRDEPGEERGGKPGRPGRLPVALAPLPAMYVGMLPCADCMGIQYQLNLLKDGAYMQRTTYLRSGHDASYYEVGRWDLAGDQRTLRLEGGREGDAYWELKDASTLRKLDREGRPIESRMRYELKRAANVTSIAARVRMRGMVAYFADAARFRDCLSGLEWPVTMGDDYLALERAYSRERRAPGAELMVMIEGRVVQRRKTGGEGTEPALVVEKFLRALPGEPCPPRGGPRRNPR